MPKAFPTLQETGKDLMHLLFPECCLSCSEALESREELICLTCQRQLPISDFHNNLQNHRLYEHFRGWFPFLHVQSYLRYGKASKVQRLIHGLKYEGKSEIGELLGRWHGSEPGLKQLREHYDSIVPVPLHPRKLSIRGYNQAEVYGKGLSEALDIPLITEAMERTLFTNTQTKKNREERLENVSKAFRVKHRHLADGKRILLVDDVMTTGATLESCALKLSEAGAQRIGVCTIAFADDLF